MVQKNEELSNEFLSLDRQICQNSTNREEVVVKEIVNSWGQKKIDLGTIFIDRIPYRTNINLHSCVSHQSYIQFRFKGATKLTEVGDLIFLVDYILKDTDGASQLLSGRISVLQAKKEDGGTVKIIPHQHFLMEFWPTFAHGNKNWSIQSFPDTFSFYLFLRDLPKRGSDCGTVLSAPYVSKCLGGINYQSSGSSISFCPSSLSTGGLYKNSDKPEDRWDVLAKPFYRFLKDSALQYVGSESKDLRQFVRDKFRVELLSTDEPNLNGSSKTDKDAKPTYLLRISVEVERSEDGEKHYPLGKPPNEKPWEYLHHYPMYYHVMTA